MRFCGDGGGCGGRNVTIKSSWISGQRQTYCALMASVAVAAESVQSCVDGRRAAAAAMVACVFATKVMVVGCVGVGVECLGVMIKWMISLVNGLVMIMTTSRHFRMENSATTVVVNKHSVTHIAAAA